MRTAAPTQMNLASIGPSLQVFLYLQVLDVLTTYVGLRIGLGEASPFIRHLMELGPLTGLVLSKGVALALAGFCVWSHRYRAIRLINYWYAVLVLWNMTLIVSV